MAVPICLSSDEMLFSAETAPRQTPNQKEQMEEQQQKVSQVLRCPTPHNRMRAKMRMMMVASQLGRTREDYHFLQIAVVYTSVERERVTKEGKCRHGRMSEMSR